MNKWQRINYQPVLPLGEDGRRITGSKEHIELSRMAAAEGMVLIKNEGNALPLKKGEGIVLMGKGTIDYVKGGGGSGDVTTQYVHNIADGMNVKAAEGKVSVFNELVDYYREYASNKYKEGVLIGMLPEPEIPEDMVKRATEFADTVIVSISRFSGEGWDRRINENDDIRTGYTLWPGEEEQREKYKSVFETNDFYLSAAEKKMLDIAKNNFSKVIVVMNVGGVVDTNWTFDKEISAVLMSWQGGMEGGLAAADILCGDVTPSGHLTDTYAKELADYPSTEGFHDSADYVCYTDDIYVGYRYFETIPGASQKVNYPFGYGLSYTDFNIDVLKGYVKDEAVCFDISVKNTGACSGKQVVQLYYSAPQGLLGKPSRELAGFKKTSLLQPGETDTFTISVPISDMKSFDDTGKVKDASWVLEKGIYRFFIGDNVRDAKQAEFEYELKEDIIIETTGHKVAPTRLSERLFSDGSKEKLVTREAAPDTCGLKRKGNYEHEGWLPEIRGVKGISQIANLGVVVPKLIDVYENRMSLDEFINVLSIEDRISLLGGQFNTGVAVTSGVGNNKYHGIPNVMTADGPAGLRITEEIGVTTTAWPVATLLACSWDMELVEKVGKAIALEVKENNLGLWLAPGVNIHRSPLCGRNFEYFSEDPYLSGKAGAAIVNGAQSEQIGATPKHFAANNKETNRKICDSVVSERALREIYIRQFEIIVKESDPYMIMSSYNSINGVHASENKDLLTGILRDEWGYDGVVTTDWWTLGEQYMEVKAGNDLKMACGYPERVMEAYERGLICEDEINLSVSRILKMILKLG
ncbi:MAG: glycoside hydrolase family 3 C-terminal domain-containing protein [Lachnospiraceae bacterium]|nr:glycoside hydrolase family 3 C-terminal domain-containing protein [Lachnospiraceae bacterium]